MCATVFSGMAPPEPGELVEATETLKSRGQDVVVDVIAPRGPGRFPAVVVLHGHGGLGDGRRSGMHSLARRLAGSGYVALVPHYFGSHKPDRKNGQKNARSFAFWERTVSDTVGFASRRADVDPRRIGLLGASLGSWVALSVGARDRRVSAVVEHYGGFPEWEELNPARMPPVLILHGDADRDVPVRQAYNLEQILVGAGVAYEMHVYEGAGHGFRGADYDDAIKRTVDFFDTHVKREPQGQTTEPARKKAVEPNEPPRTESEFPRRSCQGRTCFVARVSLQQQPGQAGKPDLHLCTAFRVWSERGSVFGGTPMNSDNLETKFARIGARVKLTDRPSTRPLSTDRGSISLDVQNDRRGEFFEIVRDPANDARVEILDIQPADRHLLLLVRQEGEKSKFLCGHDERHWFVAAIPESAPVGTVRAAKEALKPVEVQATQAQLAVAWKARNRRKNAAYHRQGEWFFIPVPNLKVDEKLVLRDEPISRGRGSKPHRCECCYRTGGELVYVSRWHPDGVSADAYRRILEENPGAKGWGWRAMRRNASVYVRGRVRHADHKTINMVGWHKVLMNTERASRAMRNVAFLD